jgi:predicted sulfurtransferase
MWVDRHAPDLAGKRILMCCTGGVRCERASAYVKSKGAEFSDVYQLDGGIVRYLEKFPDGGFFRGSNFVYDSRCVCQQHSFSCSCSFSDCDLNIVLFLCLFAVEHIHATKHRNYVPVLAVTTAPHLMTATPNAPDALVAGC